MAEAGELRVVDVSRDYSSTRALDAVSMVLPLGVTALLGRNGAGKSTLSRIVAGADAPTSGEVVMTLDADGRATERRDRLRRTGWLPQDFAAPKHMTVSQVIRYAAWLKEVPRRMTGDAVTAALASADLVSLRTKRVGALSGGMVRRLGIAQAMVHSPDVVILDEPTAGLDPEQRAAFYQVVAGLAGERRVLLSTHLLEDVAELAEHVFVLDGGLIRFGGPTTRLAELGSGTDLMERLRSGFLAVVAGIAG